MFRPIVLSLILATICGSIEYGPIVKTPKGIVKGRTFTTRLGKEVDEFLGIPFAEPPTGKLRLKDPLPAKPWTGILNATEFPSSCPQKYIKVFTRIHGIGPLIDIVTDISEDCLYLNLWVPNPRPEGGASVVVSIHGGGYIMGSSSMYLFRGHVMASEERIIFVNFNYRLGSFGFAYLDDPEADTNIGLMDQSMALRWVQKNIASFGGDPKKVTLMGQSAGAICVGLHMVSPISKGLFQRVILQSGSPLFEKGALPKTEIRKITFKMAENMGCPVDNSSAIYNCFMESDMHYLIDNQPYEGNHGMVFFPIVDGKFLHKKPEDAFRDGDHSHVQMLSGFNKNEGTYFLVALKPFVFNPLFESPLVTDKDMEDIIDLVLPKADKETKKAIWKRYYTSSNSNDILSSCENLIGDILFKCAVLKLEKAMAESANDVYSYHFDHQPKEIRPIPKWFGVMHALELCYVSGYIFENSSIKFVEEDQRLSIRMMTYWANFAKSGNPNFPRSFGLAHWPAYTKNDHRQLVLANNSRTIFVNHKEEDCDHMDKIISSYLSQQ